METERRARPTGRLRALIEAFVHMIIDELHGHRPHPWTCRPSPRPCCGAVIAKRDRFDRGMRRVLEEGMADGRLRAAATPSS